MQDQQQQQLNYTSMTTTHDSNMPSILSEKCSDPNDDKIVSQTSSLGKNMYNNEEKCGKDEPKSILDETDKFNDAEAALRLEEDERKEGESSSDEENGRERLKRHRVEIAGRVWIPDIWGQEELLKDWIDCSAFDASLMNTNNIVSARAALVEERRRANSSACRLRIENSC